MASESPENKQTLTLPGRVRRILTVSSKTVYLVGTVHVSRESVENKEKI